MRAAGGSLGSPVSPVSALRLSPKLKLDLTAAVSPNPFDGSQKSSTSPNPFDHSLESPRTKTPQDYGAPPIAPRSGGKPLASPRKLSRSLSPRKVDRRSISALLSRADTVMSSPRPNAATPRYNALQDALEEVTALKKQLAAEKRKRKSPAPIIEDAAKTQKKAAALEAELDNLYTTCSQDFAARLLSRTMKQQASNLLADSVSRWAHSWRQHAVAMQMQAVGLNMVRWALQAALNSQLHSKFTDWVANMERTFQENDLDDLMLSASHAEAARIMCGVNRRSVLAMQHAMLSHWQKVTLVSIARRPQQLPSFDAVVAAVEVMTPELRKELLAKLQQMDTQ